MFFTRRNKEKINTRLTCLCDRLKIVEDELFVENYFYSFPDSQGTKMLPRRESVAFLKLCHDYIRVTRIVTFYTNEADYKNFESLIKQWEKKVKEWKDEHGK